MEQQTPGLGDLAARLTAVEAWPIETRAEAYRELLAEMQTGLESSDAGD